MEASYDSRLGTESTYIDLVVTIGCGDSPGRELFPQYEP